MSCNPRLQAQIPSLMAGELGAVRSWLLRRHITSCPECQLEARRAQDLLSGLTTLAVASTTEALRARVFDQLIEEMAHSIRGVHSGESHLDATMPGRGGQSMSPLRAVWAVSRGNLVPLIALFAVAVAGTATTGYLLGRHKAPSKDYQSTKTWSWYTNLSGRVWRLSGTFQGNLKLESGDSVVTTWQVTGAGNGLGEVWVTVNGLKHRIAKPGKHEILDADGALLGYLTMEAGDSSEVGRVKGTGLLQPRIRAEQRRIEYEETLHGLGSVHESSPFTIGLNEENFLVGTRGSLSYRLAGPCILRLSTPTRAKPFLERYSIPPLHLPAWAVEQNRLAVYVSFDGHGLRTRRYGRYTLRDDNGVVLIVEVSPVDAATRKWIEKQVEHEQIRNRKLEEQMRIQAQRQREKETIQQGKQ